MKKFNNKSGFTLIEIIVVMIIVGILAAIALPNLFTNVLKGKASTAIASLDALKTQAETCAEQTGALPTVAANCIVLPSETNGFSFNLGAAAANAAATATSGLVYKNQGTPSGGNMYYTLTATDGTNTITLDRDSTGTFSCSAPTGGVDQGVC